MLIISLVVTVMFYAISSYLAYVTAAILYHGVRYKLVLSVTKSLLFIGICYISIIADMLLFGNLMYSSVFLKNGLLLVLITSSLAPANHRKELDNVDKGE